MYSPHGVKPPLSRNSFPCLRNNESTDCPGPSLYHVTPYPPPPKTENTASVDKRFKGPAGVYSHPQKLGNNRLTNDPDREIFERECGRSIGRPPQTFGGCGRIRRRRTTMRQQRNQLSYKRK